jgi:UDP-N-acetylmuramate dehydrogenase
MDFFNVNNIQVLSNYNLLNYNSFRLNCICSKVAIIDSAKKLIKILEFLTQNNLEYVIIAKGTNILLPPTINNKIVLLIKSDRNKLKEPTKNKTEITIFAGMELSYIATYFTYHNYSGLEWAGGIPGSIGGAIFMNAGAFCGEIKNCVKKVKVYDLLDKKIKILYKKDCEFSYRNSIFQSKRYVIINATLVFIKQKDDLLNFYKECLEKRKASQPIDLPSAGCVFKNKKDIPCGKIIDEAKLKGKTIGGAMISKKHANFIVNFNNATYLDIIELIEFIKKVIYDKYSISLETEIQIL